MNDTTQTQTPYQSREAFLADGMHEVTLDGAHVCSICREPLMTAFICAEATTLQSSVGLFMSLPHVTNSDDAVETHKNNSTAGTYDSTARTPDAAAIEPESAVRIFPCNHMFGRTCLMAWFTSSRSNRCPECNQELFLTRHFMLFLREPTPSMRLTFAEYIERVCSDHETAQVVRNDLMSEWTRRLIREFAMELWRQQGYEVEYQYIVGAEEQEEEDNDMFDDNAQGRDEIGEMETDRHEEDDETSEAMAPR